MIDLLIGVLLAGSALSALAAPVYEVDVYVGGVKEQTLTIGEGRISVKFEPVNIHAQPLVCSPSQDIQKSRCNEVTTQGNAKVQLEVAYYLAANGAVDGLRLVEHGLFGWNEVCGNGITDHDGRPSCLLLPVTHGPQEYMARIEPLPKEGRNVNPDDSTSPGFFYGRYQFHIRSAQITAPN